MPSLRELDLVKRLNAPTRGAATTRRRLRKGLAAVCAAAGVVLALPGTSPSSAATSSAPSSASPAPAYPGRHILSVPAEASLKEELTGASRVDLWATDGSLLARSAPVVGAKSQNADDVISSTSAEAAQTLLVALTRTEVQNVARHKGKSGASADSILVTVTR